MPATRRSHLAALVLCASAVSAFAADNNAFDARWKEAERNVKSGKGQHYFDEVFFKEFFGKYAVHATECTQRTGERILPELKAAVELDARGRVRSVLVRPESKPATCFAELVKRDRFSPPPSAHFWVPVTIKFTAN